MRLLRWLVLVVGAVAPVSVSLMAVSCGSPSAPSASELAGTWNVVTIRATGGVDQSRPGGATYQMTIENGRVTVRADCNTCSGSVTRSASTLTIGPGLACTRAACATAAFESAFTTILAGDHAATFSGGTLTLTSARGVVRFER